jgi:hypothetical protein
MNPNINSESTTSFVLKQYEAAMCGPLTEYLPGNSRRRLLCDLNFDLEREQIIAETLLKAFDLNLHDCDTLPLGKSSESYNIPSEAEVTWDSFTDLPPSHSQNPFLSTPLRLKHFSRLSPSILRGLLRSPSLRSPSLCDDSLDSVTRAMELVDLSDVGSPLGLGRHSPPSQCVIQESYIQSRQTSLPLTPPPTGRIPFFADRLPGLDPGKLQHHISLIEVSFFLAYHAVQTHSLISPATVRNFQRVIDEMKGIGSGNDADNNLHNTTGSRSNLYHPSCPSSPVGDFIAQEVDSSPPDDRAPSLGALEEEFVSLLQQRATEEEREAQELRTLASRLESIGNGRRRLALLIGKR